MSGGEPAGLAAALLLRQRSRTVSSVSGGAMTVRKARSAAWPNNFHLESDGPGTQLVASEVLAGLQGTPKWLPSKLFYDARGSELFNAITRTEAYYPTRLERAIFSEHAQHIAATIGTQAALIELGPGDMSKVRLLLPSLQPTVYVAVDVSEQQLIAAGTVLAREHPWMRVVALCADFVAVGPRLDAVTENARRVAFFPGSTIGNFEPQQAHAFLGELRSLVGHGGAAIVGVDLQKPKAVLDAAYNDPEGWTRAFNLNVLSRLNRELGANFDERRFAHRAFYDEKLQRVEMHLVSMVAQQVHIAGQTIAFAPGESIHTENSYKYRIESFERLARESGWAPLACLTDSQRWFGVFLLAAH
jgi:dimethylhistidine N-methyltransferase